MRHEKKKHITILAVLFAFLASTLAFALPVQANPSSLVGETSSVKKSLTTKELEEKFINYNKIVVPKKKCKEENISSIFANVKKQKIKKTLWYPYFKVGEPKKYKRYKKNSVLCVATYNKSFFPNEEYNQVPGQILYKFPGEKKCVEKAEKVLPDKGWRELWNAEIFSECLVLGTEISPQEAMLLWKHPNTLSLEYDSILTIN